MSSYPGDHQELPPRGPRGPEAEHQAVMQRRAIAAGVIVLFLIVIVLLGKGCESARQKNGIKDFIKTANSLVSLSNQSSHDFFAILTNPGDAGATEIETSVNEQRSQAAELVRQAEQLSSAGDLKPAKQYLIDTLEFRRDGLTEISKQIGQALGDQDPEAATQKIAANMQQFLTSDVIYSQRAYAYMEQAVKDKQIEGVSIPTSQFLPSLDWLDPAQVSNAFEGISGASNSDTAATPGTHGTGITGVTVQPSGTALSDGGTANLAGAKEIEVDVQNQGENDETDVTVTVTLTGGGNSIPFNKTIASLAAGDTAKVSIPLTRTPDSGTTGTMKVSVKQVPGEKNLDNNSESFDATF